jgi:septum formation protein
MGIVLASASPRRRELLEMLGFRGFSIIPADTEEVIPARIPEEAVQIIAREKARAVKSACGREDMIIAADTLVYLDGEALGKPRDEAEAKSMLSRLSGRKHTVLTGVALVCSGRELSFSEASDVFFRSMSDKEIAAYVKTGEPMDKAGAYGVQGCGAVFINRIDGDFFNVMGLPLCRLVQALGEFGIELPMMQN